MEIPWRQSSGNLAYGTGTKKTPDHDLKTYSSIMLHDRNMMLNGNYTGARWVPCASCGKKHEDWKHFCKCKTYKPIWKKSSKWLIWYDTRRRQWKNTQLYGRMGIPIGTKQDGNAINREQALIQHDNVETYNTHTHESIESQNRKIESHRKIKNKDNMETNTVSIDWWQEYTQYNIHTKSKRKGQSNKTRNKNLGRLQLCQNTNKKI